MDSVKRFSAWVRFSRSRSSKVIDFGTNRKYVLVRFRYIAGFLCSLPTPISPFWGVPFDQISRVGVSPNRNLKLISREIIFELFQPVWKTYPKGADGQMDRQTDRRTDGRLTEA